MADNTLPTAVQIGSLTTYTITETVGGSDTIDYYKFNLDQNGSFNVQISGVSQFITASFIKDFNGNAGIDSGDIVDSLSVSSTISEIREAEKGEYFFAVERSSSVTTNYTLTLNFTPVPGNTDSNPGNTLSTALNLGSFTGTKILKDYIGDTDTIDYYKFILDENSSFGWQIQDLEAGFSTVSLIKDVNKNGGIDSNDTLNSFTEDETIVSNRELEAGEYFIGVQQFSSTNNTNYTLQLDVTPVPDNTDKDPGNDLNNALNVGSISGQKILKDFVGATDTVDYYKFTLDQNGAFGWQIQDLEAGFTTVSLIKDFDKDNGIDSGEVLNNFTEDETIVSNRQLEAGEYIIGIEKFSTNNNTNYTLQLDFAPIPATTPSNPGNDLNNALDLGILSSEKALTDFVGFTDTSDFYKFTLDKSLKLSWQVSNLADDLQISLIQDLDGDRGIDNNEVINTIFSDSAETTENDLAAGEYFIRVSSSSSTSNNSNYTLTLTPPPTSQPPATGSGALDADGDGKVTFAQDGLLLAAFTFFNTAGRTDFSVLNKFIINPNASRKDGNAIAEFLKNNLTSLDADGNGRVTFAQDGLLLAAFSFFNTPSRTDFNVLDKFILATDASRKTGNAVADFLKGSLPSSSSLTAPILDGSPIDNDELYVDITGTDGDDTLIGGDEKNSIVGGAGNDIITSGGGKDILQFGANSGNDSIADFQVDNDLIRLESSLGFADANAVLAAVTYDGLTAELVLSDGNTLTIKVDRSLTSSNFSVI
jgi:hypothetical protein